MEKRTWIVILAMLLFTSCASRKVTKEVTDLKSVSYEIVKDSIEQKTTTITKISDSSAHEELIIEAMDELKEMIVDGKKYQNVRIKTIKNQNDITTSIEKDERLNQTKITDKGNDTSITSSTKESEKQSNEWMLIVVIVGVVLIITDYNRK